MTAKTAAPTPGPWRIDEDREVVRGMHGGHVARCPTLAGLTDDAIAEANARHIVACVNSHETLVAACRAAERWLDTGLGGDRGEILGRLRAALATTEACGAGQ